MHLILREHAQSYELRHRQHACVHCVRIQSPYRSAVQQICLLWTHLPGSANNFTMYDLMHGDQGMAIYMWS
jgi:hypothetical protein